jgi:hypothetical protein
VPPPFHHYVKPQGKRLLQPLHYQHQHKAVVGLDAEREPRPLKPESAYLEAVTRFCLAKYAMELAMSRAPLTPAQKRRAGNRDEK